MTQRYFNWGEPKPEELKKLGFRYCDRKMKVTMITTVAENQLPMTVSTSWGEELEVGLYYVLAVIPKGDNDQRFISDMHKHPIRWDKFVKTYRMLDIPLDSLTDSQYNLVKQGARPYYRFEGLWAKEVTEETWIKGLEHKEPVKVPLGNVLVFSIDGEPYSMERESFEDLYISDGIF